MELAFVFLLVGYGTKAGLAPMHTWLPDAHAEAPAAVSAMMSGVLLAVALYALARWKAVVDLAAGRAFSDTLLLGLGLASVAVAALSLVAQRNYKRLLAYSSIEHTGLTCLGLGLGPAGTFAALLHLANHALTKAPAFLLAGRVLERYGTASTEEATGLLRVMPWTGRLFAAALLGLLGLPPFGLFISEYLLFRAGFQAGRPWLMAVALGLVGVAFVAVLGQLHRMLHGRPGRPVTHGERAGWTLLPLAVALGAVVVLGLVLPDPVARLLAQATAVLAP
jgi:hydrogenase-4 component F